VGDAVQSVHEAPPVPQEKSLVPGTQEPELQQPPLQGETGLHMIEQATPLHASPMGQSNWVPHWPQTIPPMQVGVAPAQETQAAPLLPHADAFVPGTHMLPVQQPPLQIAPGLQTGEHKCSGAQASPFGQSEAIAQMPVELTSVGESPSDAWLPSGAPTSRVPDASIFPTSGGSALSEEEESTSPASPPPRFPSVHDGVHSLVFTAAPTHAPFTHVSSAAHETPRHDSRRSIRIAISTCGSKRSSRLATMQPLASVGPRQPSGGWPSGRVITANTMLSSRLPAGTRTTLPIDTSLPSSPPQCDEADEGAFDPRPPLEAAPTSAIDAPLLHGTSL
jgi:hypothetical protein